MPNKLPDARTPTSISGSDASVITTALSFVAARSLSPVSASR